MRGSNAKRSGDSPKVFIKSHDLVLDDGRLKALEIDSIVDVYRPERVHNILKPLEEIVHKMSAAVCSCFNAIYTGLNSSLRHFRRHMEHFFIPESNMKNWLA